MISYLSGLRYPNMGSRQTCRRAHRGIHLPPNTDHMIRSQSTGSCTRSLAVSISQWPGLQHKLWLGYMCENAHEPFSSLFFHHPLSSPPLLGRHPPGHFFREIKIKIKYWLASPHETMIPKYPIITIAIVALRVSANYSLQTTCAPPALPES